MRLEIRLVAALALLGAGLIVSVDNVSAQDNGFEQIDRFESLGTSTLRVGAPPKTIVDDDERHIVILTIWDSDAETKIYWRSPDTKDSRTTVIPGRGIQTFQTLGVFRLEAIGEPNKRVKYGYVLLGLRK
jgi:hypothetical protein